jgi:hypothetical protein
VAEREVLSDVVDEVAESGNIGGFLRVGLQEVLPAVAVPQRQLIASAQPLIGTHQQIVACVGKHGLCREVPTNARTVRRRIEFQDASR